MINVIMDFMPFCSSFSLGGDQCGALAELYANSCPEKVVSVVDEDPRVFFG
jgi:hypothetical protein